MSNFDYAKYVPAARHKNVVEMLKLHVSDFVVLMNSIAKTVDKDNSNPTDSIIARIPVLNLQSYMSKKIIAEIQRYTTYDLVYNDDLVKGRITHEQYQDICILDQLKRMVKNTDTVKVEADLLKKVIVEFEKLVPTFK